MHYCMSKFVSGSLWYNEKSDLCGKCGMRKNFSKNKCCKEEHKVVKVIKDPKVAEDVCHSAQIGSTEFVLIHITNAETFVISNMEVNSYSNTPPLNF